MFTLNLAQYLCGRLHVSLQLTLATSFRLSHAHQPCLHSYEVMFISSAILSMRRSEDSVCVCVGGGVAYLFLSRGFLQWSSGCPCWGQVPFPGSWATLPVLCSYLFKLLLLTPCSLPEIAQSALWNDCGIVSLAPLVELFTFHLLLSLRYWLCVI